MTWNVLIGGAAGQGIETTAAIFEKLLKKAGFFVFSSKDFMSRVRGGHNFTLIRFGSETITSHSSRLDGLVALDEESIHVHLGQLSEDGFILCDSTLVSEDPRSISIAMSQTARNLGNPRVSGSVAIGALLGLFGLNLDHVGEVLSQFVREEFTEINSKAVSNKSSDWTYQT